MCGEEQVRENIMLREILFGIGVIGLAIFILILLLLPLVCTIILGTFLATNLGFTGLVWWAFVILFYLIIMGILGLLA